MKKSAAAALVVGLSSSSLIGLTSDPATARKKAPPVKPATVIAVVETGVNVLHEDFLSEPGTSLPKGLPPVERVHLDRTGDFEAQLEAAQAGPLGNLEPGVLYHVAGTRLLVYAPEDTTATNLFEVRDHGTGVASAAAGRVHGKNPEAFVVVVTGLQPGTWEWLAGQEWIDVVSAQYTNPLPRFGAGGSIEYCYEFHGINQIVASGRMVFSASGNGTPEASVFAPSAVPGAYQVGGVDKDGRTYVPPAPTDDGNHRFATPNRAYETGDRFGFQAADPDALTGGTPFGGTSGATPTTAARATQLIQLARETLDSPGTGVREGALALAGKRAVIPPAGPLSDGKLTSDELVSLLHHVARPMEPPNNSRYLVEGFGGLNDEAIDEAKRVLLGLAEEPTRNSEDAMHGLVESVREAFFVRCY